jgi:hypothetical protein
LPIVPLEDGSFVAVKDPGGLAITVALSFRYLATVDRPGSEADRDR